MTRRTPDPENSRQARRYFRHMGMTDPVYLAYLAGGYQAERRNPRPNPYPPGKRHDEFERGFKSADPWGDYHGRNE